MIIADIIAEDALNQWKLIESRILGCTYSDTSVIRDLNISSDQSQVIWQCHSSEHEKFANQLSVEKMKLFLNIVQKRYFSE